MCISASTRLGDDLYKTVGIESSDRMVTKHSKKKNRPHLIVQHHYHDHSLDRMPPGCSPAQIHDEDSSSSNMSNSTIAAFPTRLYEMLLCAEPDGFADIVSWQPHGRCFLVHKPEEFKEILPRFFKLSKVPSFQRQVNLYGFTRLTRGLDKGAYYNELFLRGKPWLCHNIQRIKVKGTGVRAKSNPTQEPDFWSMTWVGVEATRQNSASSVVSQDEEEESDDMPLPIKADEEEEIPSMLWEEQEPKEESLIFSWGLPFHYLHRGTPPHTAVPDLSTSCAADVDSIPDDEFMRDMETIFW